MLGTPQITWTADQPIAVIHITVPREEIQQVMGPGLDEVLAAVEAQGMQPTGPWFTHHLRTPGVVFDFEVGVPVGATLAPAGRVKPGRCPAMRVARAIYRGGYEGLAGAWGEFEGWIRAQGLRRSDELWECYLAGPESGPDPAGWRTQLDRPLIG